MEQADMDRISEIVTRYGYVEWTLIEFDERRNYNVVSYFTAPGLVQVFKEVIIKILKKIDCFTSKNEKVKWN